MVFPSATTLSEPGEPIFILTGIFSSRSMSCFRLTACVLMSCQKKQRLISTVIGIKSSELLCSSFRQFRQVHDAFCLQQMASLVYGNDFQRGSDSKPDTRNKRILKPYAIHVVIAGAADEFAGLLVAAQKSIQN